MTDDLRQRITTAVANLLEQPNGHAYRGMVPEAVMAVVQPALDAAVSDRDRLAAIVQQARDMHRPIEGLGWHPDGRYDDMPQACTACGTYDEYGVVWPCAAYRALDEALKGQP